MTFTRNIPPRAQPIGWLMAACATLASASTRAGEEDLNRISRPVPSASNSAGDAFRAALTAAPQAPPAPPSRTLPAFGTSIPLLRPQIPPLKPAGDPQVSRTALSQGEKPPPIAPELPASGGKPESATKAVATFTGTAAPGLRLMLDGEASTGEDRRFLWVQTKGTPVTLDYPDRSQVWIMVPGNATELAFALVVVGRSGIAQTTLEIPVQLHARPVLPPTVVADAGDDQLGLVVHRVTLNGIRSTPRDRAGFRWVQVEGPEVRSRSDEAWVCSFVPVKPGLYRFLLVTACDGVLSQPSWVKVVVSGDVPAELASPGTPRDPIEEIARAGARSLDGGPRLAPPLAAAFEAVARRTSLYESYNEMFSELARRLDDVLPSDSAAREDWDRAVFVPLTRQMLRVFRGEGLDLDRDEVRAAPLKTEHKDRLAVLLERIARGFRDAEAAPTAAAPGPTQLNSNPNGSH